jgi:hypothetical protein
MTKRLSLAALMLLAASGWAGASDSHHAHKGDVGKVAFQNSCAPSVQADLLRGVAMLHSFWYNAGETTFRAVLARDPGCAIASWGIASLMMSNSLAGIGSTPAQAEKVRLAIEEARRVGVKTERERDYLEAVAAYFQDWAARPERERQIARSKAYEALAAKYPADDEAQIFNALYIAGTQSQADQTYAAYARAVAILGPQFTKFPDHPGVAHYLIHSFDAPPIAPQGLDAARKYAGLAPDAPHALHMPSHIFTRVGAWRDSASSNLRSFNVAVKDNDVSDAYHASDYMVYAELQLGRDAAARVAMENALKVAVPTPTPPAAQYALAAMPARLALERGDWTTAAGLTPPPSGLPFTQALTQFARGIAAARLGDAATSDQAAQALAELNDKLVAAKNLYWASEVENQRRAVMAWANFARGQTDAALAAMTDAADREDKIEKHIVTPGRLAPARELLGDMLMLAKRPADALRAYEQSQVREPNRFRGYLGAALAAEAAGDATTAKAYFAKLLDLAKDADSGRAEIARARAYVTR